MMEPTKEPVLSRDFDLVTIADDFNEAGEYRWPYALLNRRAWQMLDRPSLEEISSRQFSMAAASGIVRLTDEEAERILKLRRKEVALLTSLRIEVRLKGEEVARRRGAPPPTTTRTGIMHLRRAPAYTYAMQIDGALRSTFKIGWTFDHGARARHFNLYSLPKVGGLFYHVRLTELWDTARQAFRMEQDLLSSFDAKRHTSNREVIYDVPFTDLDTAWRAAVQKLRYTK